MIEINLADFCHFKRDSRLFKRWPELLVEWRKVFPDVDILEQLRYSHEWLVRNKPGYSDMGRYLSHWFRRTQEQRTQERRVGERRTLAKYVEQRPHESELMSGDDWARMRQEIKK